MKKYMLLTLVIFGLCSLSFAGKPQTPGKRYKSVAFRRINGGDRWIRATHGCMEAGLDSVISKDRNRDQIFDLIDLNGGRLENNDQIIITCEGYPWIADNGGGSYVTIEHSRRDTAPFTIQIIKDSTNGSDDRLQVYLVAPHGQLVTLPDQDQIIATSSEKTPDAEIELVFFSNWQDPNPTPATAGQSNRGPVGYRERWQCTNQTVEAGWYSTEYSTSISCGTQSQNNQVKLLYLQDAPVGSIASICANSTIPKGWESRDSRVSATCGKWNSMTIMKVR